MKKVFVGMSGGVDSSATAYLLLNQGYSVTGITFIAFCEECKKNCGITEDYDTAKGVCKFLGIEHKIINFRNIFESKIINYFIDSYKKGLIPNPCILCNKYIKFGVLLEYSLSQGADYFATGHYATIEKVDNELLIKRGIDKNKDQSYFLSYIENNKLPYIILPLGNFHKPEIRNIIDKNNIPINPHKKESQDICFITSNYQDFLLSKNVPIKKGPIIYKNKIIGEHIGIPFYSFGQRKGLNISVGEKVYIRKLDVENNTIYVGNKPMIKNFNIINVNTFTKKLIDGEYEIQVRHKSKVLSGNIKIKNDSIDISLNEPFELITPGQFCVIYKNNYVYASGEINDIELIE